MTYTPAAGWSGVDTFTYPVSDGTTVRSATVAVTTLPAAVDDLASTPVNTSVNIDLVANDHGQIDPTTVVVAFSGVGALGNGGITINGLTGVTTYSPDLTGQEMTRVHTQSQLV